VARPKMSPMDVIVAAMKKNRNVTYAEVKAAADKKKLTIYPIMFGRAQLMLGIVKRKNGAKAKATKGPRVVARRGRRASTNGSFDGLEGLVASVRNAGREGSQLRSALTRIRELCDAAL
jgi:hypothetical protein